MIRRTIIPSKDLKHRILGVKRFDWVMYATPSLDQALHDVVQTWYGFYPLAITLEPIVLLILLVFQYFFFRNQICCFLFVSLSRGCAPFFSWSSTARSSDVVHRPWDRRTVTFFFLMLAQSFALYPSHFTQSITLTINILLHGRSSSTIFAILVFCNSSLFTSFHECLTSWDEFCSPPGPIQILIG